MTPLRISVFMFQIPLQSSLAQWRAIRALMGGKFPWISDEPRERIKEKVGAGVREVFRHANGCCSETREET